MSDVVERVAAELADADDGIIFDLLTPDEAEFYLKLARRALTAVVAALGLAAPGSNTVGLE